MSLVMKRVPWSLADQIRYNLDETFDGGNKPSNDEAKWIPAVDIKEESNRYIIYADIPGVDPKEIDVTVDQGYLTLKGHRKQKLSENQLLYQKTERLYGDFVRQFKLPESVDSESISAKGEFGVLEVILPKTEKSGIRKIHVVE